MGHFYSIAPWMQPVQFFGVLLHFRNFFISFVIRSTWEEINLTWLLNLFLPSQPNEWEKIVWGNEWEKIVCAWESILTFWNVGNVVNYCGIFIILPHGCSWCNFLGLLLNFCNFCFFCRQINSRENKIGAAFESLSSVTPQWMGKDCVWMREIERISTHEM